MSAESPSPLRRFAGDANSPSTANASATAFAAGNKVRYFFAGYGYPATVLSGSRKRCRIRYDDATYPDEDVAVERLETP